MDSESTVNHGIQICWYVIFVSELLILIYIYSVHKFMHVRMRRVLSCPVLWYELDRSTPYPSTDVSIRLLPCLSSRPPAHPPARPPARVFVFHCHWPASQATTCFPAAQLLGPPAAFCDRKCSAHLTLAPARPPSSSRKQGSPARRASVLAA